MISYQALNDQQSLLGASKTSSGRPMQHYDSLTYSMDKLEDLDEAGAASNCGNNTTNNNNTNNILIDHDPFRLARHRDRTVTTSARVARRIFGGAVVVGLLVMWVTKYAYDHDDGADWARLVSSGDRDDDSIGVKSFADLLPVPLLGRSRSYKAQHDADHARAYMNMDASRRAAASAPPAPNSDEGVELLGSSRSSIVQAQQHEGCEGTVMILRHCEKGRIREHCNYMGYERSVYLASLFGSSAGDTWPSPSYIFAETPGARRNPDKRNYREVETITPLAQKFNLTVDITYSAVDSNKLARHIQGLFRDGTMCGKLLVVSWKHSKIPRLASALACGPREGCPHRYPGRSFDDVWQVKFVYRTPLHSSSKHLKEPRRKEWLIFGSVQPERFDPLSFSKQVGDYPRGGTKRGGRWRDFDYEIPERTVFDPNKPKQHHDSKKNKD